MVVRDLDAAERFYVELLGLRLVTRHLDGDGRHRSTWVALDGDRFLAIERAGRDAPRRHDEAPGHHCLALRIRAADRSGWVDALTNGGVAIERMSAFTLYVRDPDGALIGLSHYPEPSTTPGAGTG